MTPRVARWLAGAALLLWAGAAQAQGIEADAEALGPVEAGVFCTETTGERLEAPGSVAGHSNLVSDIELRAQTLVVPVSPDLTFGFRAPVREDAPDAVLRISHPPFRGNGATGQWFAKELRAGEATHALYSFDEAYEMVEGLWRLEIVAGARRLVQVTILAVPAEAAPHLVGLCDGLPQISRAPQAAPTPSPPAGSG